MYRDNGLNVKGVNPLVRVLTNKRKVANIGTLVIVLLYAISLVTYILLRKNYNIDTYDNSLIIAVMTEFYLVLWMTWRAFLSGPGRGNWRYMENEVIGKYGFGYYSRMTYERIKCIVIAAQCPFRNQGYKRDKNRKKYAMLASYSSEIYGRRTVPNQKIIGDTNIEDGLLCATYLKLEDLETLLSKTTANVIITEDMLWYHKEILLPVLINCADRVMVSCRYDNYDGFKHLGFMEYLSLLPR